MKTSELIKENNYLITFEAPSSRLLVVCNDYKSAISKYKKAGYRVFGCAVVYINGYFFKLRKDFKQATRNHKEIVIGNQEYFIRKHLENNTLTYEK